MCGRKKSLSICSNQCNSKMFQSALIARFHHLYLLQTIIEIQNVWNRLYAKLKHKVLFIVDKRLRSNLIKSLKGKIPARRKRYQDDRELDQQHYEFVGNEQRNLYQDLNTILTSTNQQHQGSVSVPMQILMMPMLVQPYSLGSQPNNSYPQHSVNPTLEEFVTAQRQQPQQQHSIKLTAAQDRICVKRPTYKSSWSSVGDMQNIHGYPSAQTMRNFLIS